LAAVFLTEEEDPVSRRRRSLSNLEAIKYILMDVRMLKTLWLQTYLEVISEKGMRSTPYRRGPDVIGYFERK